MRRLFAALIVVMVALSLAGCGGGGDEAPTTETPETPAQAPANPTGGGGGGNQAQVQDDSPLVEGFPMPFPTDPEIVPAAIQERLDAGQPMLIFYYDSEHEVVNDVRGEIDAVLGDYRGLITMIEYGVYEDMFDVTELDQDLGEGGELTDEEKEDLKKVYRLADELSIGYTPFIILVDREGTITWMYRGYIDRDTLELEVQYATQ